MCNIQQESICHTTASGFFPSHHNTRGIMSMIFCQVVQSVLKKLTDVAVNPFFHFADFCEVYWDFKLRLTSSAGGAKGCFDRSFCAPLACTFQLLALHQHRVTNQYRTAYRI